MRDGQEKENSIRNPAKAVRMPSIEVVQAVPLQSYGLQGIA